MKSSCDFFYKVFLIILFVSETSLATNVLTVQNPEVWGTKPGYIDKATLVVEPCGGYVEQSLYLTYSDHNQFMQGSKLEIVHRFELPAGSVVNDLWLWIGDSVMQAILMDTWTARSIYDSIVVFKRDPAFLTKDGNQYELHVYPLAPGGQRRIKINFITPTKWFGETATAEIPLKFINSNNAVIKPLEVFFKESTDSWGLPSLLEIPQANFQHFVDTLGYHYKYYKIENTADLQSLNLQFKTSFTNGYFFSGYRIPSDHTYFQLGIIPGDFFNLISDTASHKYLVGIDLSGEHDKNLESLIPNIENTLKAALKPKDLFKIIIAGAGEVKQFSDNWLAAEPQAIDGVFNEFSTSNLADSIEINSFPTIVYCDNDASNGWQFPGIEQYAAVQNYPNIETAANYFSKADIIAAYRHGYDDEISVGTLNSLLTPLDTFFIHGGRLLSYYDFNRDNRELLASHYINGLKTLAVTHGPVKLYRNINGNIGSYFPESLTHESSYFLAYNDSSVKVELMDQQGRPAVISKKIKNGLLVVSGIWQLNDDGAMKTILDIPLLGLNKSSKYFQLKEILDTIKTCFDTDPFDKVLLFSNSDSLFQKYDAVSFVNSYLQYFASGKPVFNTINLLGASGLIPPSVSENNIDYYGSGYLAKVLSDSTYGLHFETHIDDWNFIASTLSAGSFPPYEYFSLSPAGDTILSKIIELKEVNPVRNDPNKPMFFIGSSTAKDSIVFNVSAKYLNESKLKDKNITLQISRDTTSVQNNIVPAMLGNEKLKDLFVFASYDTSAIVNLALKYHLLCDYTALIALEPNDTINFMHNPNDEGGYTTPVEDDKILKDTLSLDIYPNPFNIQTTIVLHVKVPSTIKVEVYNILGQLVDVIVDSDLLEGKKAYSWNARNSFDQTVSSGIYFVRAIVKENGTGKTYAKMKKMILLK
jgi:hypothetical protein